MGPHEVFIDGFWWRVLWQSTVTHTAHLGRSDGRYEYGCDIPLEDLHSLRQTQARDGLCSVYHVAEGL